MTMLSTLIPNFETEMERLWDIGPSGFILGFGLSFSGIEHLYSTYPQEWREIYEARNYMLGDPVLLWHVANLGRRRWSEISIPDFREVMKNAREFRMVYGAVFSTKALGKKSFFTISREDRELTDEEMTELDIKFMAWTELVLARASLTNRELDVLRSLRDGRGQRETADRLGISESTVKQRALSACAKLGATTRTQAVAIAVQRNYFDA